MVFLSQIEIYETGLQVKTKFALIRINFSFDLICFKKRAWWLGFTKQHHKSDQLTFKRSELLFEVDYSRSPTMRFVEKFLPRSVSRAFKT